MHLTVVVAHADDEALYCGGTIQLLAPSRLSIILVTSIETCNTIADDPVAEEKRVMRRLEAFEASCEMLGATSVFMCHVPNESPMDYNKAGERILSAWQRTDLVLTHAKYRHCGHPVHRDVFYAVSGIGANPIWQFDDDHGSIEFRIDQDKKTQLLELYRYGGHRTPEWDPRENPAYRPWTGSVERFTPVAPRG